MWWGPGFLRSAGMCWIRSQNESMISYEHVGRFSQSVSAGFTSKGYLLFLRHTPACASSLSVPDKPLRELWHTPIYQASSIHRSEGVRRSTDDVSAGWDQLGECTLW